MGQMGNWFRYFFCCCFFCHSQIYVFYMVPHVITTYINNIILFMLLWSFWLVIKKTTERVYDNSINPSCFIHIRISAESAHIFLVLCKDPLYILYHSWFNSRFFYYISHFMFFFVTEQKFHTKMALMNNGTSGADHCSEHLRKKIDEWLKWDRVSKIFHFILFHTQIHSK